jgi:hypothetical protein
VEVNSLQKKDSCVIFAGDYNIDLLKHGSKSNVSNFVDSIHSHGLFPTITLPTRVTTHSATLLDNIFINLPITVAISGVIKCDISDHWPVFVVCNYNNLSKKIDKLSVDFNKTFSKIRFNKVKIDIENVDWSFITNDSNVNNDCDELIMIIRKTVQKHTSFCKVKNKLHQPWITNGLIKSSNIKQNMYKLYLAGTISWDEYKNYRNKFTSLMRLQKQKYYNDLIVKHHKNSKAMWQIINSNLNRGTKHDLKQLVHLSADELNNFFSTLGSNAVKDIKPRNYYSKYLKNRNEFSLFLTPVTDCEVASTALHLPSKLTCGFDNLSVKLIQNIIYPLSQPLATIINKSFSEGTFPDILKIAKIVPVYKSGDISDIKNFRPISILPAISKIFEKLMLTRLSKFFDKHNILNVHQHGFRAHSSTTTAMVDVGDYITNCVEKKLTAIALFVDVSKAFDSLNHVVLLEKLNFYGVRGIALSWFRSYLSNRFMYTEVNGYRSLFRLLTHGVPQGSILGPYLYLTYVNDIFNVNASSKCVLYADDTVILISGKEFKLLLDLAHQVFGLYSCWFADNMLALNCKKTNFVVFNCLLTELLPDKMNFDGHTVCRVSDVKYLGFFLDSNYSWHRHILFVNDKLAKGLGMLKYCCKFLPRSCLLCIYYSFVYPYLMYGLFLWGTAGKTVLEATVILQKKCIRVICGSHYLAHVLPLARNLGLLMFDDLLKYCVLTFMFKVYNNQINSSSQLLFKKVSDVHVRVTRASNYKFYVFPIRTSLRKQFIAHVGIIMWNACSVELTHSNTFSNFKSKVKHNMLATYV